MVQKKNAKTQQPDEHKVFSHLNYIGFLLVSAFAAYFTTQLLFSPDLQTPEQFGIKALVLLGWAFIFKTFAHRIHEQ